MKQPQAFDSYAVDYDDHFTHSAIGRAQRRQVRRIFNRNFPKPCDILEVNCGTGEDAIYLAQKGHRVIATDIAQGMIEVGNAKLAQQEPTLPLTFLQADFLELSQKLAGKKFDLIFSNFGGLNCLSGDKSRELAGIFSELLKPNGSLFLVYMSKACAWERIYYTLKGQPQQAKRRRESPLLVNIGEQRIKVWYYTIKEIAQIFQAHFDLVDTRPVGLFVPPSYLEHYFAKRKNQLAFLERLDALVEFPGLANYGDHFGVELVKKSGRVGV